MLVQRWVNEEATENIIMNTGIQGSDEECEDMSVYALKTMATAYKDLESSTDLGDGPEGHLLLDSELLNKTRYVCTIFIVNYRSSSLSALSA
jgi:hypothetical protein